jgi:hypothetical protein
MKERPMASSERHEMVLEGPRPSGAEEWACPACGYRFVVRWSPDFERLVLEEGDPNVVHVGAKGGLRVDGVGVAPAPDRGADELDASTRRWLREVGIDWDGPAA